MKKFEADQARHTGSENEPSELTEQELMAVAGGDGPPSTAGDGNGRVYSRGLTS